MKFNSKEDGLKRKSNGPFIFVLIDLFKKYE